jgi:5-methylcytosine-specific restriction endonuclease McrA
MTKQCRICHKDKDITDFYKSKITRDKLMHECKICTSEARKLNYRSNPEIKKAAALKWYYENHEEAKKRNNDYRWKNRDVAVKRTKDWCDANRDYKNQYDREYYQRNKLAYYLRNENRRAAKIAQSDPPGWKATVPWWREVMERNKNRCSYCNKEFGKERLDRPTMEHKIPLSRGGKHSVDNIVPACRACNDSKSVKTPDEWRQPVYFMKS